jgi:hypothetical protein
VSNLGEGPLARSSDLIIEELGGEVLVYDTITDQGHALSPEAARVWRACNGNTPVEQLSSRLGLDQETVDRALAELDSCELLEVRPSIVADGSTRREVTIRLAKVGAVATALPLIVSVAAPTAAMAVSRARCLEFSGNCGSGGGGTIGCHEVLGCCCCTSGAGCPDLVEIGLPANCDASCKECLPAGDTCPGGSGANNCQSGTGSPACNCGTITTEPPICG